MKQSIYAFYALAIALMVSNVAFAQKTGDQDRPAAFPDKLLATINTTTTDLSEQLEQQTNRYVNELLKAEKRIAKRMSKKFPAAAAQIFAGSSAYYQSLGNEVSNSTANRCLGRVDTLKTALKFLCISGPGLSELSDKVFALGQSVKVLDNFQSQYNRSTALLEKIRTRQQFLTEQLSRYDMIKTIKKLQHKVYQYQGRLDEISKRVKDGSIAETAALAFIQRLPGCKNFFKDHALSPGLFGSPGPEKFIEGETIPGLQTRNAVQQLLTERFGSPKAVQTSVSRQVQQAATSPSGLSELIPALRSSGTAAGLPGFKRNAHHTKPWKKRLELGSNLQTVKGNFFFPTTVDIGFSLGYKLNDQSTVGVGGSYKLGLGKEIRHISITHQGLGLRSFIDYKINRGFWFTGGAETNYRSQLQHVEVLRHYSAWQKSGLIGISKKQRLSNKIVADARLLYDILWRSQVPRTQPLVFRIGYSLQ